ncbi:MAG: tetratricopeptide repeat protein [Gammaproteobacteria bacterium]|nr:tetratricopeptide repeat protein [Gammaproteobacteria bacterium]
MTTRTILRASALALLIATGPALADDYGKRYREVVTAYQSEDWPAMQAAAERALATRPDYPPMLEIRAMAHALAGDMRSAVADLDRVLAMNIPVDLDNPAFAELPDAARDRLARMVSQLDAPFGAARRYRRGGPGDTVPEGFVLDGEDIIIGSIRNGTLLRISAEGTSTVHEPAGRHWSIFGMMRRDRELWFVSSDIPEFGGPAVDTEATTGLFRFDLDSGELDSHFLPGAKTLGDLWADDSGIYVSDAAGGVWAFRDAEFEPLVPAGERVNPQGLVMLDGRLIVADYRGGLVSIDPHTGARQDIGNASQASLYGIDGLATDGRHLYAVQNGIAPARVVRLRFDSASQSITSVDMLLMNHPDFDEPTLLRVAHDKLYIMANSHWNRFDADGQLPADAASTLSPPTVLEIALP